jgi:hypothetical protein
MKFTLDQQLAEVRREIEMRRRVYASWVRNGKMRQDAADRQIACMEAVHETVRQARMRESMTGMTGQLL